MSYTTTSKAVENIKKIEEFSRYLKNNWKTHSTIVKKSDSNFDDIANSLAFITDYAEVSEKIMKVINEYCEKTGFEF